MPYQWSVESRFPLQPLQDRWSQRHKAVRADLEANAEAMKALDGSPLDLAPEDGLVQLDQRSELTATTLSEQPWEKGTLRYNPASGRVDAIDLRSGDARIALEREQKFLRRETTTVTWERTQPRAPLSAEEYRVRREQPQRPDTLLGQDFPAPSPYRPTGQRVEFTQKQGRPEVEAVVSDWLFCFPLGS